MRLGPRRNRHRLADQAPVLKMKKRRFADVHCAQGRAVASELPEHLATQWEKLADGVARSVGLC